MQNNSLMQLNKIAHSIIYAIGENTDDQTY